MQMNKSIIKYKYKSNMTPYWKQKYNENVLKVIKKQAVLRMVEKELHHMLNRLKYASESSNTHGVIYELIDFSQIKENIHKGDFRYVNKLYKFIDRYVYGDIVRCYCVLDIYEKFNYNLFLYYTLINHVPHFNINEFIDKFIYNNCYIEHIHFCEALNCRSEIFNCRLISYYRDEDEKEEENTIIYNEDLSNEDLSNEELSTEQLKISTRVIEYDKIYNPKNTNCPISLNDFCGDNKVIQILHCGHIFDCEEFYKWIYTGYKCPICRYDLRNYVKPNKKRRRRRGRGGR